MNFSIHDVMHPLIRNNCPKINCSAHKIWCWQIYLKSVTLKLIVSYIPSLYFLLFICLYCIVEKEEISWSSFTSWEHSSGLFKFFWEHSFSPNVSFTRNWGNFERYVCTYVHTYVINFYDIFVTLWEGSLSSQSIFFLHFTHFISTIILLSRLIIFYRPYILSMPIIA